MGNFQATPWSVYASQTIPEHICSVNSPGGSWNTVNAFAWSAGVSTKVTCINVTIHKIVRSWYSLECHTASGGLPFFHSVPCCYQVHAPNRQQDSQSCLCAHCTRDMGQDGYCIKSLSFLCLPISFTSNTSAPRTFCLTCPTPLTFTAVFLVMLVVSMLWLISV